jgi:NADPH2:quinone reductase
MMVTFGNASGPVPDISPLMLSQKGSLFLTRPTLAHYVQTREDLLGRARDLFEWIAAGELDVHIDSRYALQDAGDAHRALESRNTTGKVLIIP